jgi:hypothetical protein
MYGYQVLETTSKLLVSMKTTRTPSGKIPQRKNSVRLMNMRPSMTKGKDINLALRVQEDTCTSHLRCQNDGRHKARLVAGGHLTETTHRLCVLISRILRGIRIVTFLSELNGCETWSTDVCVLGKLHTGESVHRRGPRVRIRVRSTY